VLVSRDITGEVSAESADLDVRTKRGSNPGTAVIFAASRREASGDLGIDLGILDVGPWAEVLFENRWVPIVNQRIVDHFEQHEAHVYFITNDDTFGPPTSASGAEPLPLDGFRIRVLSNPVRDRMRAHLRIPEEATARFTVHDVSGRVLGRPEPVRVGPTEGWLTWDGRDVDGRRVAPGIYFLRGVASTGEKATARVVLRR
jgi:hypothetical protein